MGLARAARAVGVIALLAAIIFLAGCGAGGRAPVVLDRTLTVTEVTDSSFTLSWSPAENEPGAGFGYRYELYTSSAAIETIADLELASLQAEGTASDFGEETLSATVSELDTGTGYRVNVAAVNRFSGEMALYDDVVVITDGGRQLLDSYSAAAPFIHRVAESDGAGIVIDYAIDLGSSPRDVFMVFSNPESSAAGQPEIVLNASSASTGASVAARSTGGSEPYVPSGPVVLRDRPGVENLPLADTDWQPPLVSRAGDWTGQPVTEDDVDDELDFYHEDTADQTVTAVCRYVGGDGLAGDETTLSIWVQKSELAANGGLVTQTMVNDLAEHFLSPGEDNDIFDWLTTIYGDEWGDDARNLDLRYIPNSDHITILVYDIPSDPGTIAAGYFWSKDNLVQEYRDYSNERIMFYLNSQYLAYEFGDSVSTLAHEFQHMISYYQRSVLLNRGTPTWLNEMMSLVSEDIVGRKLLDTHALDTPGPRGVFPSYPGGAETGAAGPPGNTRPRLPTYNGNPQTPLTSWLSGIDVLRSYAASYAFGAYITRNYGGASLLREMMTVDSSSADTIIASAVGLDLEQLLWRWGVSLLLSDSTSAPDGYRLSTDDPVEQGWFKSTIPTDHDYHLGSVNHFNYVAEGRGTTGPWIHSPGYSLGSLEPMANAFFELGTGVTGTLNVALYVPTGVHYTVVVK